jgi:hypothetical protein
MGDYNAEHGVTEELESFVRFEASAWPLVHVGRMDERYL